MLLVAGCGNAKDASTTGTGPVGREESSGERETSTSDATAGAAESNESGEAAEPEAATLNTRELVDRAKQLCGKRREEIRTGSAKIFATLQAAKPPEQKAVMRRLAVEVVVPGLEGEVDDLRALEAEGEGFEVAPLTATIEGMIAKAQEDPQKFVNDPTEYDAGKKLAEKYGVGACGALS
ncbi:MAG TPA: hypothetical protein VFG58_07470 [Solirubrobacterales bacterium]|nr:hypothetical protein [Solirubrobacterales bacterium]